MWSIVVPWIGFSLSAGLPGDQTSAQAQSSPAARGGSGRLDPARHGQAHPTRKESPMLRRYILRLNVAAFATFSALRAGRNRIDVRSELIDGARDGKCLQIT